MKPVATMLIAYLWLVQITWFLLELSVVSFDQYRTIGGQNGQLVALNASSKDFIWRTFAAAGATLMVLWADRHPLYRGAGFGSFVATTVLTFAWLSTSLNFVYNMFAPGNGNSLWDQLGGSGGIFACTLGAAVCSVLNVCGTFMLWCYSLIQMKRATSTVKLAGAEKLLHALVWLALVGYLLWTCAAVAMTVQITDYYVVQPLQGWWDAYYLHGIVAFALTAAAVASLGADQGWRDASLYLTVTLFVTLFYAGVYMARTQQLGGVPTTCASDSSGLCMAASATVAGFLTVACVAFLMMFVAVPIAMSRHHSEYEEGEARKTADPYGERITAAGEQPVYTAEPETPVAETYAGNHYDMGQQPGVTV